MVRKAPCLGSPGGVRMVKTGPLGALVGPLDVPSRRRTMQKESRVALVRHHPETALSATCGWSIRAVVLHTVAKRA